MTQIIEPLLVTGDGCLKLTDSGKSKLVAQRTAEYVLGYLNYAAVFDRVERKLRVDLGLKTSSAVRRAAGFFPEPGGLRWLEMAAGHRLRRLESGAWALKNQHRTVALDTRKSPVS